ncbi:LOW QUALITY PROTEIN: Retrotransposon nucleocapsid protein [Phytophthora palmivora]|uniref:Retrotransposon nucleocapsid protein n=1 Tax=Phytophthora palmivora TaxID=4796 RepID=A0A2P4YGY6_9STRA|nr:LOW QUALITY PROTEIN: Retrotransposon nucleocapsid protein [Phytophthora palmivora]
MVGCVIYTLIDLAQGYHQMRVVRSTPSLVKRFKLSLDVFDLCLDMGVPGMPGTWSRLIHALFDHLAVHVVYLDDICVFSKSMEEHVEHLRAVCEVLRREQLYAQLSKCSFGQTEVAFLGHMVSQAGISVDPRKTEAIPKYPTPTNRKELLSFLDLAKYEGADHPIAFYSKKLDVHERGWPTHEKELLAIKVATEKWRHYLHGRPFDVYTDNSACSWMLHHPRVSPKMARPLEAAGAAGVAPKLKPRELE